MKHEVANWKKLTKTKNGKENPLPKPVYQNQSYYYYFLVPDRASGIFLLNAIFTRQFFMRAWQQLILCS